MEKNILVGFGAFIIFFIILFFIYYIICQTFSTAPNLIEWEKASYDFKDKIAMEKESPKIVLLGGSNIIFGISAKEIEERLGIPTVNYGVNYGLSDYEFVKVKDILKFGDIIILSPEYENYYFNDKKMFQIQTIKERYILTYDKNYYNNLSEVSKMNMVITNGLCLIDSILSRFKKIDLIYPIEDYNEYGDETNYIDWENVSVSTKYPIIDFPKDFKKVFPEYQWEKSFIEFKEWCNLNNITILISYSPTPYLKEYEKTEVYESFLKIDKFFENENITRLGKPVDYMYHISLFYDTPHHLNEKGKEIRTNFIINKLKELEYGNISSNTNKE